VTFHGVGDIFKKLLARRLTAPPFTSRISGQNSAACSWDFTVTTERKE